MLLWTYLGRVLAFTLRGSVRQADSWQIIATGTALPSLALGTIFSLAGLKVPTLDAATYPTYIGYGLLAWLAIRFAIAPFFIWREQYQETTELRLELSKPERMVMERLTRHRAKARAKLAAELEDLQTYAFAKEWSDFAIAGTSAKMTDIRRLQAQAGLSEAFASGVRWLLTYVRVEAEAQNTNLTRENRKSLHLLRVLQQYLVGEITGEALALQLPRDTE